MSGKMREWFRNWRWALAASLFLHALIATFLFFGLPRPEQQPDQQEQPVNVAIVPPEQPKPKPAPKSPEPTPEKKIEKPPEQKPPPEPKKLPDDQVLKRVFQYGQKDTGPEKSLNGSSAQANTPQPAKDTAAKPPAEAKPAPNPPPSPEQQAESSKADQKPDTTQPEAKPTPSEEKPATEDTDKQQPDKQEPQTEEKQAVLAPKPLAAETGGKPAPPSSTQKAKPKPAKPMKFKSARALRAPSAGMGMSNPTNNEAAGSPIYSGLPGVRKLYSQGATGNMEATSSMENVPRDQRVANLCANVLNQELQSADYSPRWLPTIPLKIGNVLNPTQAAFSTATQWFDLTFRCEVDADATRVLSFNFRVGALVPPGEWAGRKFPSLR
ncbi:DUF930 domain-containing protein [Mesorhizobium sp. VK25A]|uniref:DUF930 domain-containing protein n=1 Tax=Mesorhizobium vachelliae TaxID=3072309 RepID=A0ABU4ZX56_9HYPH|nr:MULTISPECIES: DUF930 domain-containing protein [unclassified Mesorhizobium]MDX8530001.1 DUF930 domain-containing protein [Mesorhizobium sp. VK25D]MDX8544399.1 DUF930 domain-containing protein [Mesorhizobium sp. VK25A]